MRKLNTKGFGAVEALLIIVIVGLIAGVGHYIFVVRQNEMKKPSEEYISLSEKAKDDQTRKDNQSQQNILIIEDWDIEIPKSGILSSVKLGTLEKSFYDENDVTVSVLSPDIDASWTCDPDENGEKASIATIGRSKNEKRSGPYEPVAIKKIGEYTYSLEAVGNHCTKNPLFEQQVEAIKQAFNEIRKRN